VPVDPNLARVEINYVADDGQNYAIVTSHNHAVAVSGSAPVVPGKSIPKRWKPRLVHGVITQAGRDKHIAVVIPDKTSGLWTGATNTITVAGQGTFAITGRTGERRTQGAVDYDGVGTPPNQLVLIDYLGDDGNHYFLATARSHAHAVAAVAPVIGSKPFPRRWTPRHYNLIATDLTGSDQKMRLVEGDPTKPAWTADTGFSFTVHSANDFVSTGRKDEDRPRGAPAGP
jgi:hypothetical protein